MFFFARLQFRTPAHVDRSIRRLPRFLPTPALPFPLSSELPGAATANSTCPAPIEISSDEDEPAPTSEIDNLDDIPAANNSRPVIDLTACDSDDDVDAKRVGANRSLAEPSDGASCPIEIVSDSEESVRARRMSTIELSDGDEDEVRAALQPPAYTTEDEAEHVDGSDAELSYASDGEKVADV